jgi:hypothetical protein
MNNQDIPDFFQKMYEQFGQFSVIDFVKSRQENGDLKQVNWKDCVGCEFYTPYFASSCLVCGGQ